MTMSVYQRIVGLTSLCLALAIGSAACAKKAPAPAPPPPPPPAATPAPPPPRPPAPPPPAPAPPAAALSEDEVFARKTLDQLNAERPLGDVFFDLDQATITSASQSALSTNSNWLKRWTSTRIVVEGHCDERGTTEYNLGLGERRANAVKAYLVSLGVPAERVNIVSKGKESPFCSTSDETCWQQNRRGHFLITAK
jgi:peptidoglycan-associated lipoprotein